MSVFRAEALKSLKRWKEPLLLVLILPFAARLLWLGVSRPSIVYGGLGVVLVLISGSLFYFALLRVRLGSSGEAAGIVEVRERSIVYLSPHLGGDVSLESLSKIAISPSRSGSYNWVLYTPEQRPLLIPFQAQGAENLLHAFSALPGLSLERLNRALKADRNVMHIVWQRP
ncbi:MAG: hypothetical protein L3J37_03515 [Rhodobacteraceae bacterium]|nr:hypothetical protein [Paracoccaceae bacterium]